MKSLGKLVYSPRTHLASNERWLVLMCDDQLSAYYRELYAKEHKALNTDRSTKLTRPVWGAHISIIRGERIAQKSGGSISPAVTPWGKDANKLVEFEYEPGVMDNGEYFWLKVTCPTLAELRVSYGLTPEPKFGFHLTIGRTTL